MSTADRIERNGRVTSTEARNRQAKYRERMADAGFVQVCAWVHKHQEADTMQLLRRLKANETFIPGALRDTDTNRFVSINGEEE